jgi:hypothetical protein
VFHNFRQSDDGDFVGVDDQVASSLLHPMAAHAEKLRGRFFVGGEPAQSFHQTGAVQLARSFSRRDEKSHLGIMTFGPFATVFAAKRERPLWELRLN